MLGQFLANFETLAREILELLAKGEWQVMADYVDDALTGNAT